MTTCALLVWGLLLPQARPAGWPTLRTVLDAHAVPLAGIDDLDRQITSYAVESEPGWVGIAYYWVDKADPNRLPRELRVRVYDRPSGRWLSSTLDSDVLEVGSVMHIVRHGRWFYIDTHLTPSAGALLVLSADLKMRRKLYGWTAKLLADGRVVYAHSMVHFAPAHPGSLSLYDPTSDRTVPLYPPVPVEDGSPEWMVNRSFASIESLDATRLALVVVEQKITLSRDNTGVPNGPERRFRVTCSIAGARPRCSSAR